MLCETKWVVVTMVGLKQGCLLSPCMFNGFINDLAVKICPMKKGIKVQNDVSLLMYVDDLVLLAEKEDLQ